MTTLREAWAMFPDNPHRAERVISGIKVGDLSVSTPGKGTYDEMCHGIFLEIECTLDGIEDFKNPTPEQQAKIAIVMKDYIEGPKGLLETSDIGVTESGHVLGVDLNPIRDAYKDAAQKAQASGINVPKLADDVVNRPTEGRRLEDPKMIQLVASRGHPELLSI